MLKSIENEKSIKFYQAQSLYLENAIFLILHQLTCSAYHLKRKK